MTGVSSPAKKRATTDDSVLDKLKASSGGRGAVSATDGFCKAGRAIDRLDAKTKATVIAALADPDISSAALHGYLKNEHGAAFSASTLVQHRAERCACK